MRTNLLENRHQIFKRIPFNIEFTARIGIHERLQGCQVRSADMTLIGTRMNGQAGSARLERNAPEENGVRPIAFTRIAHQRDFIEIDGKLRPNHGSAPIEN